MGVLDPASKELTSMFAQGGLGDAEARPELVSTKKKRFYLAGFEQFLSCRSSRGSGKPRVPV